MEYFVVGPAVKEIILLNNSLKLFILYIFRLHSCILKGLSK